MSLPDLVLVGGGHAHVQVLARLAMEPAPARVTLIVDTPIAIYSGMTPGLVAGQYRADELEIDVVPLARLARARVVLAAATGIDPVARRIELEGRPPLPYDLASVDVGSTVAGAELEGVREHAIPTRPISLLVQRIGEVVEAARSHSPSKPFRVVVVGAGAGGVELAFTLEQRLRRETGRAPEVRLVHASPRPLETYPRRLGDRIAARARARGIALEQATVEGVEPLAIRLAGGGSRPFDALLWVTGAIGHPLLRSSGLELDERGFVLIEPTLQVLGHDDLFAVGDCASLVERPTPKAGVYAVRQGPYLSANLRARLDGRPLRRYRPQRDFLTLLNLGDGSAIGIKRGILFEGRWVMSLKDLIDRAFMRKFQVLTEDGERRPELEHLAMDDEGGPMACGGCAAKLDAPALERALARLPPPPAIEASASTTSASTAQTSDGPATRAATSSAPAAVAAVVVGLSDADDAALWVSPKGERIATTIDAFPSFTDDPWLVARVATLNALSDLDAKGVEPRFAQALVTVPVDLPGPRGEELLFQVLSGVRLELDRLGVTLLGGHTTTGAELAVGLAVEGVAGEGSPNDPGGGWLGIDGLRPGLELVLTKPLGTGVLFHADMIGRLRGPWFETAASSMLQPNRAAARLARGHRVEAATDVSGFGLLGHLGEMVRASRVIAELDADAVPALPGALELLASGLRSTAHAQNLGARRLLLAGAGSPDPDHPSSARTALLFDPQTSGGLLLAAPPDRTDALVAVLHATGYERATRVGRVVSAVRGDQRYGVRLCGQGR